MKSEIEKDLDRGTDDRIKRDRELLDYLRKNGNVPEKNRKEFDDMYQNYDMSSTIEIYIVDQLLYMHTRIELIHD